MGAHSLTQPTSRSHSSRCESGMVIIPPSAWSHRCSYTRVKSPSVQHNPYMQRRLQSSGACSAHNGNVTLTTAM